jgi:hypothetical protein
MVVAENEINDVGYLPENNAKYGCKRFRYSIGRFVPPESGGMVYSFDGVKNINSLQAIGSAPAWNRIRRISVLRTVSAAECFIGMNVNTRTGV